MDRTPVLLDPYAERSLVYVSEDVADYWINMNQRRRWEDWIATERHY